MGGLMLTAATVCALLLGPAAQAQGAAPSLQWQPIARNTIFETGDTWVTNGRRFRLYGVQSCLRGTAYKGPDGHKHDCGDASMCMLVGLVRSWSPQCSPVDESARAVRRLSCVTPMLRPRRGHGGSSSARLSPAASHSRLSMRTADRYLFPMSSPKRRPRRPRRGFGRHPTSRIPTRFYFAPSSPAGGLSTMSLRRWQGAHAAVLRHDRLLLPCLICFHCGARQL